MKCPDRKVKPKQEGLKCRNTGKLVAGKTQRPGGKSENSQKNQHGRPALKHARVNLEKNKCGQ